MKKIKLFTFLTGLFAITVLYSCDTEPIDPAVLQSIPGDPGNNNSTGGGNNNGGTNNGGGTSGGGTSTGDYWPTTIGNWWQFDQNGTAADPFEIVGTDTFNGATYYRFNPQSGSGTTVFGTATFWLNKNGGAYTMKIDDIVIDANGMSGVQTGYEYVVLRDNLSVNGTWNGSYSQTTTYTGIPAITQNVTYTGTILEIGATETVDGEVFNNIIKAEIVQNVNVSGMITIITTEYWFAKDIGPVKAISSGLGNNVSILTSYAIN
ncbi:hypothetical protein NHF50_15095 [Flavobacterium sp. NRK F10]|uniref:hypothetical protein n=1 Tax=Flavobacterium sp. NRK F10 TaxID=2954931 RepID=UPI002091A523|nr:hypothetical protein [Flavobacterium sp. NRK F10]MCO6176374.1 hypothetical protein [Flavobacterium sp. NRK F10]